MYHQATGKDAGERCIDAGVESPRRGRIFGRRCAGDQGVKGSSQGVQVALTWVGEAVVGWRGEWDGLGHGRLVVAQPGHDHPTVGIDPQGVRSQVAVREPRAVDGGQAADGVEQGEAEPAVGEQPLRCRSHPLRGPKPERGLPGLSSSATYRAGSARDASRTVPARLG